MVIDYYPFDKYKTNMFFYEQNKCVLDFFDNRFCKYIYKYGKNKGCICGTKIRTSNEKSYCSRHIKLFQLNKKENNKTIYYCNYKNTKKNICRRIVNNEEEQCFYHKKLLLENINNGTRTIIKYNFQSYLKDMLLNNIINIFKNYYKNYTLIFNYNYSLIYIELNVPTLLFYLFDLKIIYNKLKCDKYKKICYNNIYRNEDNMQIINNNHESVENVIDDILLSLDNFIQSSKTDVKNFIKKCKKVQDKYIEHDIKIEENKVNYIEDLSFLENYLNNPYINHIQNEILKNKTFIPINIFLECIKNFLIKFNNLNLELQKDFPRYYKYIKGYFKYVDSDFKNDAVRYMKKADIFSILI